MAENNKRLTLVRVNDAFNRLGMSKSSFYSKIKEGTIPPPIQISRRMAGYEAQEVDEVIKGRMKNLSENEMIKLSQDIVERRKTIQ